MLIAKEGMLVSQHSLSDLTKLASTNLVNSNFQFLLHALICRINEFKSTNGTINMFIGAFGTVTFLKGLGIFKFNINICGIKVRQHSSYIHLNN